MSLRPLAGIKITEATSAHCPLPLHIAIAMCGRIAASLGADVTRMIPASGDVLCRVPPLLGRSSSLSVFLNRDKQYAIADDTVQVIDALQGADVDANLLDDDLCALATERNERRIIVNFRLTPERLNLPPKNTEFTIMALAGMLDIVGDVERQPLRLAGHHASYTAALAGYTGLAAALCRTAPIPATTVDVALLDAAVWLNWKTAAVAALGGESPSRAGRQAEWQIVRCADGWIALVYRTSDWDQLKLLVRDARLDDPLFASPELRRNNIQELTGIVESHFATRTRMDIYQQAKGARIPLGPVWDLTELLTDPQNAERRLFDSVVLPDRTVRIPRLPVLWNGGS